MCEALQARELRVRYLDADAKPQSVLDIAALDFAAGTATAIMGPSGSGKTTLLYALCGLAPLQPGGSIVWRGQDQLARPRAARDRFRRQTIGFVFQDFQLIPELSPLENVLLPARFDHFATPATLRARAGALLERFGVPVARCRAAQLSRGEAQRVALARALLRDPPLILADEPTASLDSAAAGTVIAALGALARDEGKLVITVTHDPVLAAQAGRVLRLDHGRIISDSAGAA